MNNKFVLIGLGAVIVIIALAYWLHRAGVQTPVASVPLVNNSASTTTPTASHQPVPITAVDPKQLPQKFPADIPLEVGATIIYNYNAVNAQGQFQATREFISKKSADANFTFYQTALKASGWNITAATDDTARNQKIILASKGSNNLNIRIYTDNGQVKVSINNLSQP